jgi:U32 family peptidase
VFKTKALKILFTPLKLIFETLESINCKTGIVPVYFYPELFYSRMPVQLENGEDFGGFDAKSSYKRYRKNGITIIVPDRAVSILHHKNRLSKIGFSRFLIDVSYDTFSKNRFKNTQNQVSEIGTNTTHHYI